MTRSTPIDLDGAHVVITGGARGIGRATAQAFVARGARVSIGDLDLDTARTTAAEIGASAHRLDVADAASYDAFVTAAGSTLLVVGDVNGHDQAAAATMGQLRNLLRGMAYDSDDSPAVLLGRLRALPGTRSAAVVSHLPMSGATGDWVLEVEGHVHRVTRLTIDLEGAATGVDFGASVPEIYRLLASRPATSAISRSTARCSSARLWPRMSLPT